jgi:hypothetical protein
MKAASRGAKRDDGGGRSRQVEAAAWPVQAARREGGEADRWGPQGSDTGERASWVECATQRGERNLMRVLKAFGLNGLSEEGDGLRGMSRLVWVS